MGRWMPDVPYKRSTGQDEQCAHSRDAHEPAKASLSAWV